MTSDPTTSPSLNPNTVVISLVVVILGTLAAIIGLAFAVEDGARFESMVTIILANTATNVGVLVLLVRQDKTGQGIQEIRDNVNGKLEARMEAAVHRVFALRDQEWQRSLNDGDAQPPHRQV